MSSNSYVYNSKFTLLIYRPCRFHALIVIKGVRGGGGGGGGVGGWDGDPGYPPLFRYTLFAK